MRFTIAKQTGYAMKVRIIFPFCLYWLLGSGLGFWIFASQQTLYSSLMRSAVCCSVSIVGLLVLVIFPFAVTAFVVAFSKLNILYVLCFLKATLYSLNVISVYSACGGGGWLAQLLILFLDNCSLIFLWLLWINANTSARTKYFNYLVLGFVICTLIWVLDQRVISQFAVSVFNR